MKLAIVFPGNVDKLIDYREHARNLAVQHEVHLFCREGSLESSGNLHVHLVRSATRNPLLRRALFFLKAQRQIRRLDIPASIVFYGLGASMFGLLVRLGNLFARTSHVSFFDLRSGSVFGRLDGAVNFVHRLESLAFQGRVALSRSLGELVFGQGSSFDVVGIGTRKAVPFQAEQLEALCRQFGIRRECLLFIYAGIFTTRDLHVFFQKFDLQDNVQILLVGDGDPDSMQLVHAALAEKGLTDKAIFTGWISYDLLQGLYALADVGIAYVPVEERFQLQPPTKLFDYVEFGMSAITTKTLANLEAAEALEKVYMFEDYGRISELPLAKKARDESAYGKRKGIPYWDDLSEQWIQIISRRLHA